MKYGSSHGRIVTTIVLSTVLFFSHPAFAATFNRPLTIGSTGTDVSALQTLLKTEGLYTYATITGYFGILTKSAVQLYQSAHGISHTGYVGPLTLASLNAQPASGSTLNTSNLSIPQMEALLVQLEAQLAALLGKTTGTVVSNGGGGGGGGGGNNTPPPPSAPAISAISTTQTPTTATITWTTDQSSDSSLVYGLTTAYGSASSSPTLVTSHSLGIKGLATSTLYHYEVVSSDTNGISTSSDQIFTTPSATPPIISAVVSTAATTTASVTWTTDLSSNSKVVYGTTTAYGSATSSASFVTSHSIGLTNLASTTTYHYAVVSTTALGGAATSSDHTLTTLGSGGGPDTTPPTVSLTAPASGATLTGSLTISATASDNVAVASVSFEIDTTTVAVDSTNPFSFTWDSSSVSNGTHTISAVAVDTSNNFSTSTITVTTSNSNPAVFPGTYYANYANGLPTSSSFFPVLLWLEYPNQTSQIHAGYSDLAHAASAAGMNTFFGQFGTSGTYPDSFGTDQGELAAAKAAGMYMIAGGDPASNSSAKSVASMLALATSDGALSTLIGYDIADEPDPCNTGAANSGSPSAVNQVAAIHTFDSTRESFENMSSWPTFDFPGCSNSIAYPNFAAPDVPSYDDYHNINVYATTQTQAAAHVGTSPWEDAEWEYGFQGNIETQLAGGKPTFDFIDVGNDALGFSSQNGVTCNTTTNVCTSGTEYNSTAPQVNSSVWGALINGANGIQWFCDGAARGQASSFSDCMGGNGSASDLIFSNLTYIDGLLATYATELNTPSSGACTMQPSTNATYTNALATTCTNGDLTLATSNTIEPVQGMTKKIGNTEYLFVMPDRANGTTTATYTISGAASDTVTLIYDSAAQYKPGISEQGQTFTTNSSGQFTDTLLGDYGQGSDNYGTNSVSYQVKIYSINLLTNGPDVTPPTVSITSPTNAQSIGGSAFPLTATASDNIGVAGVTFKVGGVIIGSEDLTSPYSVNWNTTATSSGSKTVVAVARDAAGNVATSSPITFTVDNTAPVISAIATTTGSATTTVTWTTNENATSQVVYGTTTAYGSATSSASLVTSHTIGLTGLTGSTLYHFAVVSTDAAGNISTSSDNTFTTTVAPNAVALNWFNQDSATFVAGGTSWNIGSTNASTSCGTISAGNLLIAAQTVWTNGGGDPGAMTVPSGWSLMWTNFIGDVRTAVFYKVAAGNESCSFASSWTTSSTARAWVLMDYAYTGTPPGSPIDASSSQAVFPSNGNMVAPSASPTNSHDLLLGIFTDGSGAETPYALPGDLTYLTQTTPNSEILIGYKTLSSSGATGTETATMTGSFKNVVNGLAALNQ